MDSDDEFSYTNTASILKSLKQKIQQNYDDSSDSTGVNVDECAKKINEDRLIVESVQSEVNDGVIDCENSSVPTEPFSLLPEENSDRVIEIVDDLNETPVDIIGTIESCLTKNKSKRKRMSARRTRASKRKASKCNNVIEIDERDEGTEDELEDDVNVKVIWKSSYVERFVMKRYEPMNTIFEFFVEKENISENRLLFQLNKRVIRRCDTVESLSIGPASIIEGGTLSENYSPDPAKSKSIQLKVQTRDAKHPLVIAIRPHARMAELMKQCADRLELNVAQLKFYFDGELLDAKQTPSNLDLEGGECIDCVVK